MALTFQLMHKTTRNRGRSLGLFYIYPLMLFWDSIFILEIREIKIRNENFKD
jgi:hypothetical protein